MKPSPKEVQSLLNKPLLKTITSPRSIACSSTWEALTVQVAVLT